MVSSLHKFQNSFSEVDCGYLGCNKLAFSLRLKERRNWKKNSTFFVYFYISGHEVSCSTLGFIRQLQRPRIDFESSEVMQCLFDLFIIYIRQVKVPPSLLPIDDSGLHIPKHFELWNWMFSFFFQQREKESQIWDLWWSSIQCFLLIFKPDTTFFLLPLNFFFFKLIFFSLMTWEIQY